MKPMSLQTISSIIGSAFLLASLKQQVAIHRTVKVKKTRILWHSYGHDNRRPHGPSRPILLDFIFPRKGKNKREQHRRSQPLEARCQFKKYRKTFAATFDTLFYRLHLSVELIVIITILIADGCPIVPQSSFTAQYSNPGAINVLEDCLYNFSTEHSSLCLNL